MPSCDICKGKYCFSVLSKFGTMEEFREYLEDNDITSWSEVCCCTVCDSCRKSDQCPLCMGIFVHKSE